MLNIYLQLDKKKANVLILMYLNSVRYIIYADHQQSPEQRYVRYICFHLHISPTIMCCGSAHDSGWKREVKLRALNVFFKLTFNYIHVAHLNEYQAMMWNCLKEVIRCPTNRHLSISQFIRWHQFPELSDTPCEHCRGECHGKTKFNIIPRIIIPSLEVYSRFHSIWDGWVTSPRSSLISWKPTRPLPLEK